MECKCDQMEKVIKSIGRNYLAINPSSNFQNIINIHNEYVPLHIPSIILRMKFDVKFCYIVFQLNVHHRIDMVELILSL